MNEDSPFLDCESELDPDITVRHFNVAWPIVRERLLDVPSLAHAIEQYVYQLEERIEHLEMCLEAARDYE